jgi:dienelactone hydrolase
MASAEEALDSQLHEQVIKIPVVDKGPFGGKKISLEATIFKPDGNGPFPLLVMSHGSTRGGEAERHSMKRSRFVFQSREFVNMGFAVIIPMRRGYGNSEGGWAEGYGSCSHPMYHKAGLEGAKDLIAAVQYMKKLPYVDGKRVVLAGYSTGGFASVAAASIGFDGLVGVINFSGVRGTPKPDFICQEHLLIDTMGKYGSTSRVPTLWYYSENDHYIPQSVARKMFDAYTKAGGRGDLVMQAAFGEEGHLIFIKREGMKYWMPVAKNFLTSLGFKFNSEHR